MKKTHARRLYSFTMFELLAVLAIVVIIMSIMVPAFTRITQGRAIDMAGRLAVTRLRLARQYAVTQRKKVAVIMPRAEGGKIMSQYQYTAIRLAIVTGSSSPYTFSEWMENSKWGFCPAGTAIMEADADEGIANGAGGWQVQPHENPELVDDVDLKKIETNSSGVVDGVRAIIFLPSGKMAGGAPSRYVTIGEAANTGGGNWVIKDIDTNPATKNASCKDQVSIECDYYTGRAVYRTPDEY